MLINIKGGNHKLISNYVYLFDGFYSFIFRQLRKLSHQIENLSWSVCVNNHFEIVLNTRFWNDVCCLGFKLQPKWTDRLLSKFGIWIYFDHILRLFWVFKVIPNNLKKMYPQLFKIGILWVISQNIKWTMNFIWNVKNCTNYYNKKVLKSIPIFRKTILIQFFCKSYFK